MKRSAPSSASSKQVTESPARPADVAAVADARKQYLEREMHKQQLLARTP